MRSVRCFCLPLEKTTFELNFSAMETLCCNAMHVCFTHFVVRVRLNTSYRRDTTSRSMNLLRELFQSVNKIVTKSARFASGMIRVRSLALMHDLSWARTHEYDVLKLFPMDSGLQRSCNSGLPRSIHRASILQAKIGFRCIQMSTIRLLSTNTEFWVGPLFLFSRTPLLKLSVASGASKWGHFSVSLGSLMRSMMALCFCTIVGMSD